MAWSKVAAAAIAAYFVAGANAGPCRLSTRSTSVDGQSTSSTATLLSTLSSELSLSVTTTATTTGTTSDGASVSVTSTTASDSASVSVSTTGTTSDSASVSTTSTDTASDSSSTATSSTDVGSTSTTASASITSPVTLSSTTSAAPSTTTSAGPQYICDVKGSCGNDGKTCQPTTTNVKDYNTCKVLCDILAGYCYGIRFNSATNDCNLIHVSFDDIGFVEDPASVFTFNDRRCGGTGS